MWHTLALDLHNAPQRANLGSWVKAERAAVHRGRALAAIVRAFGPEVLLPDGTLDRPKLGRIVFADEEKRRKLNAIVHPAVRREMFWSVLRYWWRGERICVLDVPLLIEGGLWKWVGKVLVVYW